MRGFIFENVEEYVDTIKDRHGNDVPLNTLGDIYKHGGYYVYSRCKDAAPFANSRFTRDWSGKNNGGGESWGSGIYSRLHLQDVNGSYARQYGKHILKIWMPDFERYMFDCNKTFTYDGEGKNIHNLYSFVYSKYIPEMSRKYGVNLSNDDPRIQYMVIFGNDWLQYYNQYNTSPSSMSNTRNEHNIIQHYKINGFVYKGDGGLDCVLHKDYARIMALAYSDNDGKTFNPIATATSFKKALKDHDSLRVLGKDAPDYKGLTDDPLIQNMQFGGVEMYSSKHHTMRVRRKRDGLFNYIDCQSRDLLLPFWLKYAEDIDDVKLPLSNGETLTYKYISKVAWDAQICNGQRIPSSKDLVRPQYKSENPNGILYLNLGVDTGTKFYDRIEGMYPKYNDARGYRETRYVAYVNQNDELVVPSSTIPGDEEKQTQQQGNVSESLWSRLINEAIEEYAPEFKMKDINANNPNFYTFYRLAPADQTSSIAKLGFSKEFKDNNGTGHDHSNLLGYGTYGCQYPIERVGNSYGNICWKFGIPKNVVQTQFLCPHDDMRAKYGIKETYDEQLQKFFPDLYPIWQRDGLLNILLTRKNYVKRDPSYAKRNNLPIDTYSGTQVLLNLQNLLLIGNDPSLLQAFKNNSSSSWIGGGGRADHLMLERGIVGCLYYGAGDTDCVFCMDDSMCFPFAWKDNRNPSDNWHDIEMSHVLYNRTANGYDPSVFLKGKYGDYINFNPSTKKYDISDLYKNGDYRVYDNFMRVKRKIDGKYNFVKGPQGGDNFLSQIWFDNATIPESFIVRKGMESKKIVYSKVTFPELPVPGHTAFLDINTGGLYEDIKQYPKTKIGNIWDFKSTGRGNNFQRDYDEWMDPDLDHDENMPVEFDNEWRP